MSEEEFKSGDQNKNIWSSRLSIQNQVHGIEAELQSVSMAEGNEWWGPVARLSGWEHSPKRRLHVFVTLGKSLSNQNLV